MKWMMDEYDVHKHHTKHKEHKEHKEHSKHTHDMDRLDESAMDHHIKRTFKHVEKVIENPPATWATYMDTPGGLWKILEMEMGEATAAYKAMKLEVGTHHDFVKQLCHVIASATQAYATMTCDD